MMKDKNTEMRKREKIIISGNEWKEIVYIDEIMYIDAYNGKTTIHTATDEIETRESLLVWGDKLKSKGFWQVHKSYLVSIKYIKKIKQYELVLQNTQERIPISRRRYSEFEKNLKEYINNY